MPRRVSAVPELFLGLLSLAVATIVVAHIVAGTILHVRHTRDTVSITASARKPIRSNLVQWSLIVREDAPTAPPAARRLRVDSAAVVRFLRQGGIPADAITPDVVTSEKVVTRLPKHRVRVSYHVAQGFEVTTRKIDVVEAVSRRLAVLLERGIDVGAEPLAYLSTRLTQAKLDALQAATAEARRRAGILVAGLGGKLGRTRSSSLGVYQIVPRNSTDVSDYGIDDTTSRLKDVTAVVSATFDVKR